MKKFHMVLYSLLLALCLGVTVQAQEAVIPIRNRQELEAMADQPEAHYSLEADIDLGDADWIPISFRGTLEGKGHTIYNMTVRSTGADSGQTVDGNYKWYDTRFAGLFSQLEGATVTDLHILGADVEITTDDNCFAAILAGSALDTTFSGCSAEGRVRLYTTNQMVGISGLVGFGHGEIRETSVDCELIFADRSDRNSGMRCEQFMGGLVATGAFNLYDNQVTIRGYDSCYGYVHNGGLNGMHYVYRGLKNREVVGNSVEGFISFFEHNPNRRAYCEAYIGEPLPGPNKMRKNTENFTRDEQRNATEEIKPHSCENPQFDQIPVPHTDKDFGYTLNQCKTCDYSYRSHYVAPGHITGDWVTRQVRTYKAEGKMELPCTVCGEILEEKVLPKLIPTEALTLSQTSLSLTYKDSSQLTASISPENADNRNLVWTTSDPHVVKVDSLGNLTAVGRGQATVTCQSQDGFTSAECQVSVGYSFGQWLIVILLFGWIWY